jgi:hypothetical protein
MMMMMARRHFEEHFFSPYEIHPERKKKAKQITVN